MKKKINSRNLVWYFITWILWSSPCSGGEKPLPNEIRWIRESQEYESLCRQIYTHAKEKIGKIAKDSDSNLAVVIDLDETVLDNSQYQVERSRSGLSFTQETWSKWVQRREASLVPGAKGFLNRARELGFKIIFLSNRMHDNLNPTKENLEALGVLDPSDIFLLRRNKADTKEIRRNEVLQGKGRLKRLGSLKVVAYLGDQMGDFPTGKNLKIGTNIFVFPNPMYGKW